MEMQEGFSIREYASKMRSVNVFKSWPFDESAGQETVKSLLPPITTKKFTWWLDELECIHLDSDKKMKKVLEDVDESDVDVEEGLEVLKALKGKMKAQKKRSIMEIFAVAPQCQEEDGSSNSNHYSHKEINWDLKGKTNENKKNKDIVLKTANRVIKKIKKKDTCFKFKQQDQDEAIGNQGSSYSNELENEISDSCVSMLKRKPRVHCLDAYTKTMPSKDFKSIEENQNPGRPMRSILKNHTEAVSLQQSTECILKEAVEVNHYSTQKGIKHVTFLEKDDDILSLSGKPSHSTECFELHKVCGSDIGHVDSGIAGKDSTITECGGSEERLISCIVDSTTLIKQNDEEKRFSRSLTPERSTLNQDLWECDSRDLSRNPLHFYNIRNSSNSTSTRLNKNSGPIIPPLCYKDCLRTYNEDSSIETRNRLPLASSQNMALHNVVSFEFQRFPYLYPECRSGINEDFVGLPLNSQGELITSNSSAKRDFNQMMSSSVSAEAMLSEESEGKSLDFRTSSIDQLNLFPVKSYVKENPVAVVPSSLDIVESQRGRTTNLAFDFLKKNDRSLHHSADKNVPSTMRLMGKEFIVGERSFQELEDGPIWKDKHVTDELHVGDKSISKKNENLFCPSEVTINRRSESLYNTLPQFGCQSNSTCQSVFVARTIDPVLILHPRLSPGTYSDSEFIFSESYTNASSNAIRPPISTIRFPFLHPDHEGHLRSSWTRRSSLNRAPLCFDISKKGTQLRDSQTYYPHGTDSFVSSTEHTIMSCYPGILPVTSVQKRQHNQTTKKQTKYVRVINNGKRSNGQLSTLPNVPVKPLKTVTLGFHQGSRRGIKTPTGYDNFGSSDFPTNAE